MKDYIHSSKSAYESTALEFQQKKGIRLKGDTKIADQFSSYLKAGDKVLELGVGSGQLSRLLCERRLEVDAIEYAIKMAKLAQVTAPRSNIIVDEFLNHDFSGKGYAGIIGIAFIHLFDAEDAKQVMAKINSLLLPGGILMLSTTVHQQTFSEVRQKSNFGTEAYRFRQHYAPQDFEKLFNDAELEVLFTEFCDDNEAANKRWVSIVASKNSK